MISVVLFFLGEDTILALRVGGWLAGEEEGEGLLLLLRWGALFQPRTRTAIDLLCREIAYPKQAR